jgi:hypothetical protein
MKAPISFCSLPPPNSTAPRMIKYRPPCVPRRSRVLSYPSPVAPACIWLLLCEIVDWRPPKATTNFVLFIFCPLIRWQKRCDSVLLHRHRPALPLPQLYPIAWADIRLVVVSPHSLEAIESQGPVAPSIFISSSL